MNEIMIVSAYSSFSVPRYNPSSGSLEAREAVAKHITVPGGEVGVTKSIDLTVTLSLIR